MSRVSAREGGGRFQYETLNIAPFRPGVDGLTAGGFSQGARTVSDRHHSARERCATKKSSGSLKKALKGGILC